MANPVKGEVGFEADGKSYTFVLGTYARAALQRRTGVSDAKFFKRGADEWGSDDTLAVFHAGLLRHHKMTEEEVGDLIDMLGATKVTEVFVEAIELASQRGAATGNGRPTKGAGSGIRKTS